MKSLGTHPHLVSIIGCCSGPVYCLLMDYCALGDLKNYLRKYREKVRRAATFDFQQCVILTSVVDTDKPVQPPFKLKNSK